MKGENTPPKAVALIAQQVDWAADYKFLIVSYKNSLLLILLACINVHSIACGLNDIFSIINQTTVIMVLSQTENTHWS